MMSNILYFTPFKPVPFLSLILLSGCSLAYAHNLSDPHIIYDHRRTLIGCLFPWLFPVNLWLFWHFPYVSTTSILLIILNQNLHFFSVPCYRHGIFYYLFQIKSVLSGRASEFFILMPCLFSREKAEPLHQSWRQGHAFTWVTLLLCRMVLGRGGSSWFSWLAFPGIEKNIWGNNCLKLLNFVKSHKLYIFKNESQAG